MPGFMILYSFNSFIRYSNSICSSYTIYSRTISKFSNNSISYFYLFISKT